MRGFGPIALAAGLCLAFAVPARAQEEQLRLFDKVSVALEASYLLNLKTVVRLDSEQLGVGTTINFEGDLDLDASKTIPSLSAEWRIAKRHLIGASWFKVDRSSASQVLTGIQFGDIEIPIDQAVTLATEQEELRIWYRYYSIVTNRTAFGIGIGVRRVDYLFSIEAPVLGLREEATVDAPLPFVGVELRQMLSRKWRFTADFGWFAVKFRTVDGSQFVRGAGLEHLSFKNASIGIHIQSSSIDASVDDQPLFAGTADVDGTRASIFVKARW